MSLVCTSSHAILRPFIDTFRISVGSFIYDTCFTLIFANGEHLSIYNKSTETRDLRDKRFFCLDPECLVPKFFESSRKIPFVRSIRKNTKMPACWRIQHVFSTLSIFLFLFFFSVICLNINIFVRNFKKLKSTTGSHIWMKKFGTIVFFSIVPIPNVLSRLRRGTGQTWLFRGSGLSHRTLMKTHTFLHFSLHWWFVSGL
jgi:hypothetical protein